ncbi:MAG: type VI secretion system tip protein TssI/VgrG [Byssovorax sp.]
MGDLSLSSEDRISAVVAVSPCAPPFELSAGPYPSSVLAVRALRGREAISKPFSFLVDIAASTDVDDISIEADLLGKPACLRMHAGDSGSRLVRGVIASIEARGTAVHGRALYRVRLVPRLRLLEQRKNSRIFQEQAVPEIVAAVLDEAKIAQAWNILGKYRPRTYCVQYQESDLAFVHRLLAEEGLLYFFDHGGDDGTTETVIFCDSAHLYPAIAGDPELLFREGEGSAGLLPEEHHVVGFARARTLKPSAVLRRGYDFRRPILDLSATTEQPNNPAEPAHPAAEIYEHHGEDEQPDISSGVVQAELDQHRRKAVVARGESACRRLAPGHRFSLAEHPMERLDQDYVVTRVEHEGVAPGSAKASEAVYGNRFACVPAEVVARPARPKRRIQQVAETAVVVGPDAQEIHTDEHGRVKVQFPWDREGQKNEQSSCWLRVSQAWAGTGWGVQFIPRIGMEVVVTFLGGDVDRPLITGCVPNAINVPAFPLPGSKTKSGFRTQSTLGSSGFNELSFEDMAQNERIYLHAQRDLHEEVERNHTRLVRGSERTQILGSRVDRILGDMSASMQGSLEERIAGNCTIQIEGNCLDLVEGNADARVSGMRVTRIEGRDRLDVQGNADLEHAEDLTTRVHGCMTTIVGESGKKRSWVTHAEGTAKLSSLDTTEISSEGELILRVGKSWIRITEDRIEMVSAAIGAKGEGAGLSMDEGGLKLGAKGDAQLLVEKKLTVKTSDGASLAMGKEVQLDGKKILLNSPASAEDAPAAEPEPLTLVELVDEEGNGLSYQRFVVALEDGTEIGGATDKDGKAELSLDQNGTIVFPDVGMAEGEGSAKGEMMPYVVRQGDYLTKLAFVHGFDAEEVWNNPRNEELRAQRSNHDMLAPADVMYIPIKEKLSDVGVRALTKGTQNQYSAIVSKTNVTLRLVDPSGEPLTGEPYMITGIGHDVDGKTGDDGIVSFAVGVHVTDVTLFLVRKNVLHSLRIGHMDPPSLQSGAIERLSSLGYFGSAMTSAEAQLDEDGELLWRALIKFQFDHDLPLSGELDLVTMDELAKVHDAGE